MLWDSGIFLPRAGLRRPKKRLRMVREGQQHLRYKLRKAPACQGASHRPGRAEAFQAGTSPRTCWPGVWAHISLADPARLSRAPAPSRCSQRSSFAATVAHAPELEGLSLAAGYRSTRSSLKFRVWLRLGGFQSETSKPPLLCGPGIQLLTV